MSQEFRQTDGLPASGNEFCVNLFTSIIALLKGPKGWAVVGTVVGQLFMLGLGISIKSSTYCKRFPSKRS